RLVADIAIAMAPMPRAIEETARSNAGRRMRAFEIDEEFAAQDVEGFILAGMGVRRRTGARRNHVFPERERTGGVGTGGLVDVGDAQDVESRTSAGIAHERRGCGNF